MAFIAPAEEVQSGFIAPDEEKVQGGFVAPKEDSPMPSRVDMGDLGTVNLNAMPSSPSDDLAKLNHVTQQVQGFVAPPHELTPLEQSKQPLGPDDFANFQASMLRSGATGESPEQSSAELEAERQQRLLSTSGIERNVGGQIKDTAAGIGTAGNLIPAGLADVGTLPQRESGEAKFPNVQAVLQGQKPEYQTTYEQPYIPKSISLPGKTAAAGLAMAPKLAATVGAEAVGIPAPVATGLLFGFDDEGNFHPDQAGIAAVLPTASKWVGGITSDVAAKLGIQDATKLNLANAGGRYATANAIIAAQSLPDWSRMTVSQRQDAVAGILSQGLIGLMDFHGYDATDPNKVNAAVQDAALKAKSGVKPFEVSSESGQAAPLAESPKVGTPPLGDSRTLATINDAIGSKLDEIKALLQQQTQPKEANEQVQRPSEETVTQTGSNQHEGVGGVHRSGSSWEEEIPSQSSGGEEKVNETISSGQATQAIPERTESGQPGGAEPVRPLAENQTPETGAAPVETDTTKPIVDRPVNNPSGTISDFEQYQKAVADLKAAPLDQKFALQQQIEDIKNRNGGMPPKPPDVVPERSMPEDIPSLPERGVNALEQAANRAKQRIINRRGYTTFGSGPLHEIPNIADWGIVGAAKIARGVYDFSAWSREMINEYGDRITPVLKQVYQASIDHLRDTAKQFTPAKSDIMKQIESDLVNKPKTEPIQVNPKTALKEVLSKSEAAGEAGRVAGIQEGRAAMQPKLDALNEQLSQSVSKSRALNEYFAGQKRASAGASKATKEDLAMADRWSAAEADSIRKGLLNAANDLPVSERGKFTNRIAQAVQRPPLVRGDFENWYRRAFNLMGDIKAHADELYRQSLASDIKDMVNKSVASPSVDLDYKNAISKLVKALSFVRPSEATKASLQATRDFINRMAAQGKDTQVPDEILKRVDLLNRTPIKDLPVEQLEALHDEVKRLTDFGKRKLEARQNVWEIQKNNKLSELQSTDTTPLESRPELRPQPGDKMTFGMKIQNFLRKATNLRQYVDRALLPMDAVMDLLEKGKATYNGWLFKHLRAPFDERFNMMLNQRDTILDPLNEIIKRNKLHKQSAERIGTFAILQQEGGRERLLGMGVAPGKINQIQNSLSPGEREAYHYMRKAMDSNLPAIQKLMHRLYNIDVAPVKNYFPMQRDHAIMEQPPEGTIDPETGKPITVDKAAAKDWVENVFTRPTTQAEKGFTIERKPGAATPVKLNSFDVFNQHIQDVTHLLNTQEYLKMAGEMVRSDLFREKYGNAGQKIMNDWLDTIARQGGVNSFQRIQWMDTLRRNISKGMVGFRIASNLVHSSNSALAATHIGADWYAKGLVAALSPEGKDFLAENFREIAARSGGEPAQAELKESTIGKLGFSPARLIDQLQASGTVLGGYMRGLAEKGLNPNQYHIIPFDSQAAAMARARARRAVASPQRQDVPQAISRGNLTGGNVSLAQTMFQFQNIFLDHWSNIRLDMMKAGIFEKNPKLAAKMFAGLAALLAIETGIKYGTQSAIQHVTGTAPPKKEDSFGKQMMIHALHKIPFVGQLSNQALYGESGIPTLDAVSSTTRAAYGAATAKKDATEKRNVIKTIGGVGGMLGVPGSGQAADLMAKTINPTKKK